MARFLRKLKHLPKKILVARTDKIGDFIMTLPVFDALKSEYGMDFTILCQKTVLPLLKNNPSVDKIITTGSSFDTLAEEIKANNFDCLLILVNDPLMRKLISKLQFIPIRIGPLSRPGVFFKLTHPVIQKRSRSVLNEAEYNLELLDIFGKKEFLPHRPTLYFADEEIIQTRASLASKLQQAKLPELYCVFHQGMSGSALNWREEHYASLLEEILQDGYSVILTGSTDSEQNQNQALSEKFRDFLGDRLFDLSGQLSLREFSILIKLAFIFIGPSTGPTHIANAVGTRIISFYPPVQVQTARRWGPYLADADVFTPVVDCGQKHKCIREKCVHYFCMDAITVEAVFRTFLKTAENLGVNTPKG